MTDLTPEEEAASARAATQARLRKARREAKIRAGAESRLKTITGLGGGIQRDPSPAAAPPASSSTTAPVARQPPHADPEEVDISQHHYLPRTTARVPSPADNTLVSDDALLRQLMLDLDHQPTRPPPTAAPTGGEGEGGMEDDPMLRVMMQILGGGGGGGLGDPFNMPPPSFTNQQPPSQRQQQQQHHQAPPLLPNRYASLWRLLHTAVALALGLYIVLCTPFSGTRLERERASLLSSSLSSPSSSSPTTPDAAASVAGVATAQNTFWVFATVEALLLATRHVMDRGRSRLAAAAAATAGPGSEIVGLVAGLLPSGARDKLEMAMRYGEVLSTVKGDVLVCVFVLGVAAWWRG